MILQAWRRYWARLDWVEELSYLAILGADACLLYPWQALLFSWLGHEAIPWWALAVLIWATYGMANILGSSAMTPDRGNAGTADRYAAILFRHSVHQDMLCHSCRSAHTACFFQAPAMVMHMNSYCCQVVPVRRCETASC